MKTACEVLYRDYWVFILLACLALTGCGTTHQAGLAEPPPFYQVAQNTAETMDTATEIAMMEPAAGDEEMPLPTQISYNTCHAAPRFNEERMAYEWGRHSFGLMSMGLRFSLSLQPEPVPACGAMAFH